jgi:hypothetical protein
MFDGGSRGSGWLAGGREEDEDDVVVGCSTI